MNNFQQERRKLLQDITMVYRCLTHDEQLRYGNPSMMSNTQIRDTLAAIDARHDHDRKHVRWEPLAPEANDGSMTLEELLGGDQ